MKESGIVKKPNQEQQGTEAMNSTPLFLKRRRIRLNAKIKSSLLELNHKKSQLKREQILKTRREKIQKFNINYIPLCSDEDWEAMSAFYAKNSKK